MINYKKLIAPPTLLASCMVGLIVSPYFYIGSGALSNFSVMFSLIMLPPFLLASAFLLWRYLAEPIGQRKGIVLLAVEAASWLAIGAFLFFISGFGLFSVLERAGLFCTFFLIASALFLPLMSSRTTSLEQRIKGLPKGIVIATLLPVLISSGLLVVIYQLSPPKFI